MMMKTHCAVCFSRVTVCRKHGADRRLGGEGRRVSQWRWYLNLILKDELACPAMKSGMLHTFCEKSKHIQRSGDLRRNGLFIITSNILLDVCQELQVLFF